MAGAPCTRAGSAKGSVAETDNMMFSHNRANWQNHRRRYVSSSSPGGGTGGEVCILFSYVRHDDGVQVSIVRLLVHGCHA